METAKTVNEKMKLEAWVEKMDSVVTNLYPSLEIDDEYLSEYTQLLTNEQLTALVNAFQNETGYCLERKEAGFATKQGTSNEMYILETYTTTSGQLFKRGIWCSFVTCFSTNESGWLLTFYDEKYT